MCCKLTRILFLFVGAIALLLPGSVFASTDGIDSTMTNACGQNQDGNWSTPASDTDGFAASLVNNNGVQAAVPTFLDQGANGIAANADPNVGFQAIVTQRPIILDANGLCGISIAVSFDTANMAMAADALATKACKLRNVTVLPVGFTHTAKNATLVARNALASSASSNQWVRFPFYKVGSTILLGGTTNTTHDAKSAINNSDTAGGVINGVTTSGTNLNYFAGVCYWTQGSNKSDTGKGATLTNAITVTTTLTAAANSAADAYTYHYQGKATTPFADDAVPTDFD